MGVKKNAVVASHARGRKREGGGAKGFHTRRRIGTKGSQNKEKKKKKKKTGKKQRKAGSGRMAQFLKKVLNREKKSLSEEKRGKGGGGHAQALQASP